VLSAAVAALAVVIGTSSAQTSRATHAAAASPPTVGKIAAEVPASFKGKTLQLATDANGNAPGEFTDPQTGRMKGSDIDLGLELCKVMGVTCKWSQVAFDSLIVQLKAGKYAFSLAGMTPRVEREKSVDFITYFKAGQVWMEKKGGPAIHSALDMCGKKVAVQAGITEESDAWGFMGKKVGGGQIAGKKDHCKAAGKPDISVLSFPSEPQADATLLSGRSDLVWTDEGVADWVVHNSRGKLQVAGKACSVGRYGIALAKRSPLEKSLSDALRYLITHNYYVKVLQHWGNASGAIPASAVRLNDNSTLGPTCVPAY
jgi:polar amino acid transport system substrate-binding protein